jgi:phosphoribosylaminoimidazole-succinocarboxamide synthase
VTIAEIPYGKCLAEGKTKVIYEVDTPINPLDAEAGTGAKTSSSDANGGNMPLAYMVHKDSITAGDGAKRDVIEGKGVLSCRTTSAVFSYLESHGLKTHYLDTLDERTMLVRRAEMIPIEWVARRLATGSYVRRTGTVEGTRFDPVLLEMFLKDDANHDPLITIQQAMESEICTSEEAEEALNLTRQVFLLLEEAWARQSIQLVDLKIELGRTPDGLLLADVIDNDSWRLWPGGRREAMLDKQVYRNLKSSSDEALADVRRRYVEVAERAERFGAFH